MQRVRVRIKSQQQQYEIKISRGMLGRLGDEVRRKLGPGSKRAVVISNQRVFALYGTLVAGSLRANDFIVSHWLTGDGERFKSLRSLERALGFLSESSLERSDIIVALGGGVVGDLAGPTAAVYLRGIAFVQAPTTLLAQIDSSVGGKTGVNLPSGKNLVGAFHQPRAVVIDTETLATLPPRELTAGLCEAVKNGAVGSKALFRQTAEFLQAVQSHGKPFPQVQLEKLIAAQCAFKASIVVSDERESLVRTDHRSRRVLNFGHTVAHALEAATRYRHFRHGEAVGYGMLVAGEISQTLGLFQRSELESLREAVRLCGPLPPTGDLDVRTIAEMIGRDNKSVGGQIQWVLLERIGHARIVNGREITPQLLCASLRAVLHKAS